MRRRLRRAIGARRSRGSLAVSGPRVAIAAVRSIAARRSFKTAATVRESAKSTAGPGECINSTASAETGAVTWTIWSTRSTAFDKLRQLGEFTAAKQVVAVNIEPTEQRCEITIR